MSTPTYSSLSLSLFKANEYLNDSFTCYEGIISVKDFLSGFSVEANSNQLDEKEKSQRDVSMSDSRVRGMCDYLDKKETAFTGIIVFVTKLEILEQIKVGNFEAVFASLLPEAERFIADGQGRHTSFSKKLLSFKNKGVNGEKRVQNLLSRTLGIKVIVTNTQTIREVRGAIRQLFSDIHLNLKKPTTSLSLYFSSEPLAQLCRDICENIPFSGKPLIDRIAINGKIKQGQVWDLQQFRSFVLKMMGTTPQSANKSLVSYDCYQQWKSIFLALIPPILSSLPVDELDGGEWKKAHDRALYTKALFAQGLGYLARSVIEESYENGVKVDYSVFTNLSSLPLDDMGNDFWLENQVTFEGKTKVTIVPKCDLKIGSLLCRRLKVYPSIVLTA
ncbi:DGQHR domain-containing protein [Vibrio vulnificus]|nr:DGQHR domain-containing protein [Vibrio vulnificus]